MPPRRKHGLTGEEFATWFNDQLEVREDGCHVWTHGKNRLGYGVVKLPGKKKPGLAHRVALELKLGREIGNGLCALHSCDNPPCCNPNHLREGTHVDNVNEKVGKGRQSILQGEAHGSSKLTDSQVRDIIRNANTYTQQRISELYNISRPTISDILRGKSWKHIPREN
jgi:hypothetical protein